MIGIKAEVGFALDVEGLLELDFVHIGIGGDTDEVAVLLGFFFVLIIRETSFEEVPLVGLLSLTFFQFCKFLF